MMCDEILLEQEEGREWSGRILFALKVATMMQQKQECCAIALGSNGANEGGCRNDAAAMQLFVTMKKLKITTESRQEEDREWSGRILFVLKVYVDSTYMTADMGRYSAPLSSSLKHR